VCRVCALVAFAAIRFGPVLQLAKTANKVSTEKDYAIRASKSGNDEIGILIDGFNDMLAQIQSRDDALRNVEGAAIVFKRPSGWHESYSQAWRAHGRIAGWGNL
jgi:nitrogen fixation/metabolism regulation signal transduction histidine kinase